MKVKYNFIGYPYFNTVTGHLKPGYYDCDSLIKIAEIRYEDKRAYPMLLPTYRKDSKIKLKHDNKIAGYRVIFYGRLFDEENYALIKKHCCSLPKNEAMKFLTTHARELKEIFKTDKNYTLHMLKLFLELGRCPLEFEITYKGRLIDLEATKKLWENDRNSLGLLMYNGL